MPRTGPVPARIARRAAAPALLATLILTVGVAVPAAGAAQHRSPSRQVAPGVTFRAQSWNSPSGFRERSALLDLDLRNRHVHLDGYVVDGVLASGYRQLGSVLNGAPRSAVAVLNASFFDLDDLRQPVQGGVVAQGAVLKSPSYGGNDNLYVRSDGTAGIGPVTYVGGVRVPDHRRNAGRAIFAVNTPTSRGNQTLTLVTSALAHEFAPGGCVQSLFAAGARGTGRLLSTVSTGSARFHEPRPLAHVRAGRFALVGCGSAATWLRSLTHRATVTTWGYLAEGTNRAARSPSAARRIRTLVTGAEQIRRAGRAFHDESDHHIGGVNAETFACVSRDARHLLLGTVGQTWDEGDPNQPNSSGVTMGELRSYATHLGCWSAVALDGGGSTTLDYRPQGTRSVLHGVAPTYGEERALNNALIVSYR